MNNLLKQQLIYLIFTIGLLIVIFYNFWRNTTSPTDENLYDNPNSIFYVSNSFPAILQDSINESKNYKVELNDSISTGDFIYKINDVKPKDSLDIINILKKIDEDENIIFTVLKSNGQRIIEKKLVSKKENFKNDFFIIIPSCAYIVSVVKGGASDRAGLKPGDIILKVNGRQFININDEDRILRKETIGTSFIYTILRNNTEFDIKVKLAKFGAAYNFIMITLSGLCFFIFGAFVLIKRPQLLAARLLGFAFIFIGFQLSANFNRFHFDFDLFSNIHWFFYIISICLGIPTLFHALQLFPFEKSKVLSKKFIILVPYILGIIFFIIGLVNLFIIKTQIIDLYFTNGILLFFEFFIIYQFVIYLIFRKSVKKEQKRLSRAIKWSYFILLICFVSITLQSIFKTNTNIIFQQFIVLLLIPFAFLYTIGRYHLLDLNINIRKNIQYIFVSLFYKFSIFATILFGIYYIAQIHFKFPNIHFTGTSIEVIDRPLKPNVTDFYDNISTILISILFIYFILNISKIIKKYIDKKYYRSRLDYHLATTEFHQILSKSLKINELNENIVEKLSHLVHLKRLGIVVFDNESNAICCQSYKGFSSLEFQEFCKSSASTLIVALNNFSGEIRTEYLPEPIKAVFLSFSFYYIIPIRHTTKTVGAIFVGEKLSETAHHREDIEFLVSIAGQTSIAIENAFFYESLAKQERMKHELNIARRIQLASLPHEVPLIPGLEISGISIPAMEVGGDFYDYLNSSKSSIMVVIGDVSGKGTSAALYMSKAQGIFRTLHEFMLSPSELLTRANQLLYKYLEKSSFITAIAAYFESNLSKVVISRAGHLPLYIYNKKENKILKFTPKGIVLGLSKDKLFSNNIEEIPILYDEGDVFFFITDGVLEARNKFNQEFDEMQFLNTIERLVEFSAEHIRNEIIESVKEFFKGVEQFDDMTVVIVKVVKNNNI